MFTTFIYFLCPFIDPAPVYLAGACCNPCCSATGASAARTDTGDRCPAGPARPQHAGRAAGRSHCCCDWTPRALNGGRRRHDARDADRARHGGFYPGRAAHGPARRSVAHRGGRTPAARCAPASRLCSGPRRTDCLCRSPAPYARGLVLQQPALLLHSPAAIPGPTVDPAHVCLPW